MYKNDQNEDGKRRMDIVRLLKILFLIEDFFIVVITTQYQLAKSM